MEGATEPFADGHGRSEIFNSDQGCQFTAVAFTSHLESCGIAISMDGRGRALDNVFIERADGLPAVAAGNRHAIARKQSENQSPPKE